jgi:PncC family amidohydrolase
MITAGGSTVTHVCLSDLGAGNESAMQLRSPDDRMHDETACTVAALLHGRSIATAESCTAGRVAEALAGVPGAVDFLRGGLVAYQERCKRDLLAVSAESVLSNDAAEQMAAGARLLFGADVAVATTGVAGAEPVDGTAPGTVFIATAVGDEVVSRRYVFAGDPQQVCERASRQALVDLRTALDPGSVRHRACAHT